jgi:predicted DCC family thiol-disulfide oxidoreductase YuxK
MSVVNQYHLIYDSDCPICLKAVEGLRKLDRLGLINPVALSSIPEHPRSGFPSHQKLKEQIHLITPERKVYRGAEAVAVLATMLPRSKYLGEFLLLPGVRTVARFIYAIVARNRLRLSGLAALN